MYWKLLKEFIVFERLSYIRIILNYELNVKQLIWLLRWVYFILFKGSYNFSQNSNILRNYKDGNAAVLKTVSFRAKK